MERLLISRTQYAVGQGGFHGASLRVVPNPDSPQASNPPYTYVYDCGTSNSKYVLGRAVNSFRREHAVIDALFISHFDNDHIKGLDRLLAKPIEVKDVFIPYMSNIYVAFYLLEYAKSGRKVTDSLIDAMLFPASFFGDRGRVSRLIRVIPRGMERGEGPNLNRLDTEDNMGEGPAIFDPGLESPDATQQPEHGIGVFDMKPGTVIWPNFYRRHVDWILLPHVHMTGIPKKVLDDFKRDVQQIIGSSDLEINPQKLAELLKSKTGRDKIESAYDKIIGHIPGNGGHNKITMSLYSGPTKKGELYGRYYYMSPCINVPLAVRHVPCAAAGWLGTGDAMLKDPTIRSAYERTYGQVLPHVGVLNLPHHGSYRNFHADLVKKAPNLHLAVANSRMSRQYGHPSCKVITQVAQNRVAFHQVSESVQSELVEVITFPVQTHLTI